MQDNILCSLLIFIWGFMWTTPLWVNSKLMSTYSGLTGTVRSDRAAPLQSRTSSFTTRMNVKNLLAALRLTAKSFGLQMSPINKKRLRNKEQCWYTDASVYVSINRVPKWLLFYLFVSFSFVLRVVGAPGANCVGVCLRRITADRQ